MRRVVGVVLLVAVGAAGLAAGVFTGSGAASPKTAKAPAVTTKVTVAASEFKFSPVNLKVPVGQKVALTFQNTGAVEHDGARIDPALVRLARSRCGDRPRRR